MDTSTMIEAKKEYTTQLQQILSPRIYERFKFIFDGTLQVVQRELAMNQIQSGSVMKIFQKQLSSIKDWNESNIIEEYERIKSRSKCNYLDKLIKAVIIANMKILSTIQYGGARKNRSKIQVHIPTPTHFIHRCYVECAKEIYKNPYIFDMSATLSSKEKHQNLRDSLLIIDNGISSAIRQLLPIGDLLEQNFNSDMSSEDGGSADDDDEDERSEESESRRGHRQRGGSVSSSSEEERSEDEETEDDEEEQSEDEGQESDMSSISSSGSEADDEDEDDDEEVSVEGGGSQKSESSISKKSEALASRVESYLEDQTADDIKISIGDDRETQSILANVMEQRAEASQSGGGGSANDPWTPSPSPSYPTPPPAPASSPVYTPQPQPQPQQSSGGFIGALYNTFASSRNMKPNADDVSVPTISNNTPTYTSPGYSTQAPKPEEVKEIVFSGKIPSGFASMPQESPKAPEPPKPTPPPISTPSFQSMVPAINPSYGIYPPKIPTPPSTPSVAQPRPSGYPTKPVQAQAPVPPPSSRPTHMVTRPVKKLSLREQKYGSSTIKPLSGSSHRMSQSSGGGRESDSDDDASFRF